MNVVVRIVRIAVKAMELGVKLLLIRWFGPEGAACTLASLSALGSRLAFVCRSVL